MKRPCMTADCRPSTASRWGSQQPLVELEAAGWGKAGYQVVTNQLIANAQRQCTGRVILAVCFSCVHVCGRNSFCACWGLHVWWA